MVIMKMIKTARIMYVTLFTDFDSEIQIESGDTTLKYLRHHVAAATPRRIPKIPPRSVSPTKNDVIAKMTPIIFFDINNILN